jgi:hypothetical protein
MNLINPTLRRRRRSTTPASAASGSRTYVALNMCDKTVKTTASHATVPRRSADNSINYRNIIVVLDHRRRPPQQIIAALDDPPGVVDGPIGTPGIVVLRLADDVIIAAVRLARRCLGLIGNAIGIGVDQRPIRGQHVARAGAGFPAIAGRGHRAIGLVVPDGAWQGCQ